LQLPIEANSADYLTFGLEYQRGMRDFSLAAIALDKDLDSYTFGATQGIGVTQATKPKGVGMALREVVRRYTDEGLLTEKWAAKTTSEKAEHFALLYELIGADHDFKSVDRQTAQSVKQSLLNYPKNRRKNPLTRDLPLDEAMTLVGVEKLHPQTTNKYLQSYTALWAWAKDNGYAAENVFLGMTIARKKGQSKDKRDGFSEDQIHSIRDELSTNSSGYVTKEYQKWGSLIGIYTGARLNEISQLLLTDIYEKEGLLCFDFNDDDEGKHIKTDSSKRLVPVHSYLIKMGLPGYVSALRGARRAAAISVF
jgi:integrase